MKLQNNYTTPEQSKRLLELGVPRFSADCYYGQRKSWIEPQPMIIGDVICLSAITFAIVLVVRMISILCDCLIAIWKVLVKIELQYEANNKKEE